MSLNRRAAKRDANEPEIIEFLRKAGCMVLPISESGLPDLLCCYRGLIFLVEVKSGKGKLTAAQERFFQDCVYPFQMPAYVARGIQDCLRILQIQDKQADKLHA